MASEITVNVSITAAKGSAGLRKSKNFSADWTTARHTDGVQTIGTTHEAIALPGDITTAGVAYFLNTDPTNYIEVGRDNAGTFLPFVKLKPGELWPMRLAQNNLYAKANTAPADLEFGILAD